MSGYALTLVNAATGEPVTVAQLKDFLRIQHDAENTILASLGKSARSVCERYLQKGVVSETWKQFHDCFPQTIELLRAPVTAITHVKYYDTSGVQQTLALNTDYVYDIAQEPARIRPAYGKWWPTTREGLMGQVEVQFVAGYAATAIERESLNTAIKMMVSHWYTHREPVADEQSYEVPHTIKALLDPYRLTIL